ncbi:MAG: YlxR family protein [Actinomycetota bacterium]
MSAPVRTCVGCRRRVTPDASWIRLAARRGGAIGCGRTAPGRGAWACSDACFAAAADSGRYSRALRRRVTGAEAFAGRATLHGNDR